MFQSELTGGSGSNFKSAEFIEDDSSSGGDDKEKKSSDKSDAAADSDNSD